MKYQVEQSEKFILKAAKLPEDILKKLEKALRLLSENPRHRSLQTHKVHRLKGFFSDDVFEAYVDMQYRLTWEYKGGDVLYLRNVDNHDECLRNP